jgi:6-phosphogluconolactonase
LQKIQRTALYVSVARELTHYDLDVDNGALIKRSPLTLPYNVQYVWPHPTAPFLYAVCSNGGPLERGDAHCAIALRIDQLSRALSVHGTSVPLFARPIHVSVDRAGKHLLTAYNDPSSVTVHRLDPDASIGAQVKQHVEPGTGIYAHQVMVAPSDKTVIVVARGNDAADSRPEDPGALKVFSYAEGQLGPVATVAPNGGYGFGPRHLDFHPSKPWIYVSLERQNATQMYRMTADSVESESAYTKPTLADTSAKRRRQRSGAIHVHPNGRFVYVANRASGTSMVDGKPVFIGGENNLAVYEIGERTGEPRAIQHEDTRGIVPRTFALDSSGRILVVANSVPILAQQGGIITTITPSLAVFRVGDDGKLSYVRQYPVDVGSETMFWMGIVG